MENKKPVASLPKQFNQKLLVEMYDRNAPALYGCIVKLIPNKKLAEIILIQSFETIYGNLHSCQDPKINLFPWMLRIVLHHCKVYHHLPNAVILRSLVTSAMINR